MSNALAILKQPVTAPVALYFTIGPLISLLIAYLAGVFDERELHSPDRLAEDRQPGNLLLIFLAGLAVWILAPTIYLAYHTGPGTTTQRAVQISRQEEVTLGGIASALGILVLCVGNAVYRRDGLRRLGLSGRRLMEAIPRGIIGIIAIMPILTWIAFAAQEIWQSTTSQQPAKHEVLQMLAQTHDPVRQAALVFMAVVIAPVFEELLFRGHLQTLLRHFLRSPIWAILLTSIAFALVHRPIWTWPPIFFLSLCLGYAYERRGNLWLSMVIHALFNGISIAASYYV